MTTTLDPFQAALLAELRQVVATAGPATARRARPPRRRLLPATAAVAAAVAGAATLPAVLGDQPVYAVVEGANGVVDVRVDRLEDAAGLERALEAVGVQADITYLPVDTICAEGRYVDAVAPDPSADFLFSLGEGYRVELAPGVMADDQTLVISVARTTDFVDEQGLENTDGLNGSVGIAEGPVAPCAPVPGSYGPAGAP